MKTATVVTLAYLDSERHAYRKNNEYLRETSIWEYISQDQRQHFNKTYFLNRQRRPDGALSEVYNWDQEKVIEVEELIESRTKVKLPGMAFVDEANNAGIVERIRRNAFTIKVDGDGVAIRSERKVVRVEPELGFDNTSKASRPETKQIEQTATKKSRPLAQVNTSSVQYRELLIELGKCRDDVEKYRQDVEERLSHQEQLLNELQYKRKPGFWSRFWQ